MKIIKLFQCCCRRGDLKCAMYILLFTLQSHGAFVMFILSYFVTNMENISRRSTPKTWIVGCAIIHKPVCVVVQKGS